MLLSCIIINYKKSLLTFKCIDSLFEKYKKEFENDLFEIILVDNASGADELKVLKDRIKSRNNKIIKLIENSTNQGFSKGCNTGAKIANGERLLFLNNDTIVHDLGLKDMSEYMAAHEKIDILGGKLSNTDKSDQPSVGKFYTPLNAALFLLGLERFGIINKNPAIVSRVDWVKGGCLMVKSEVFNELSGFDEKIFMYMEDMEFCYRAKKNGYLVFFYPHVTIEHIDQGSSSREFAIINIYKNLLYFYKKHRSNNEYIFIRTFLKIKAIVLIFAGKILNNTYLISAYEKAFKLA